MNNDATLRSPSVPSNYLYFTFVCRCLLPFEHQNNATFFGISEEQKRMCYPWAKLDKNFSSCEMYDTNFNDEYFLSNTTANRTVRCSQWVYNKETYHNTVLMEVSLEFNALSSLYHTYWP